MKAYAKVSRVIAIAILLAWPIAASAQWAGRDGWIEEPVNKALEADGMFGRSYLDVNSVHRGDDGLVYFSESSNVSRPEDIGKVGFMKDAYDCARNLKYMCVGQGNWRTDKSSTINAANDPALPIYRTYLCGDANPAAQRPASPPDRR